MYTCKVLVKQGVGLATRSRNREDVFTTSETSTSAIAAQGNELSVRFSVRALAKSFRALQRAAPTHGCDWKRGRRAPLRCALEIARESDESNVAAPKFDVSSNCVTPVFRVSPFVQKSSDLENPKVRVLFLSEGNVCRSVYAEAIFNALIDEHGMQDFIECDSKGSRDYNVGESPDPRAVAVAEELGLQLPQGAAARVFECQADIVLFDLLVVMDKFNASDVLKEVTVYEAIDKGARYTQKVRRLAEFCRTKKMEDIDDPLYGNMGGPEELVCTPNLIRSSDGNNEIKHHFG